MNSNNRTYSNGANPQSYRRICSFCKTRNGAVVYCSQRGCRICFHVLCGRLHNAVLGWNEKKVLLFVVVDIRIVPKFSVHTMEKKPIPV